MGKMFGWGNTIFEISLGKCVFEYVIPNLTILVELKRFFFKSSKSLCQCDNVLVFENTKSRTSAAAENGYSVNGRMYGHQKHNVPTMSLQGPTAQHLQNEARSAEFYLTTTMTIKPFFPLNF